MKHFDKEMITEYHYPNTMGGGWWQSVQYNPHCLVGKSIIWFLNTSDHFYSFLKYDGMQLNFIIHFYEIIF